jgi:hypothetical protein
VSATTPCAKCGAAVVPVTIATKVVQLDPGTPLYICEFDSETGKPTAVWHEWRTREAMARHVCKGGG